MPLRGGGKTRTIGGPLLLTRISMSASVLFYITSESKKTKANCSSVSLLQFVSVFLTQTLFVKSVKGHGT